MSGITGLFRRSDEDVSDAELEAMVETLAHRGPDGRGTWRDGPVGLGNQHLQTTPESRYASPIEVSNDGRYVLTMDARMDNRNELCGVLELDDTSTLTDSDIMLAAYEEWDTECFERVVGAFAVVIYDREKNRLVCARDATGVKPFYYALTDDLFAFGSEPKAILSLPDVSESVDDASVYAFLAEELNDFEATFFESVARLPPGRVLVVETDDARTRSYWSPDQVGELDLSSDEAYERRFRELFTEAVWCRLRRPAETKAASYMSGGLDSTSVACVAQSLLAPEESLRTFSLTYEGYPSSDETEYLDAALDAYDFDAHVRDAGGTTPLLDLDRRLDHHDAPFYPPIFAMDQQFSDRFRDTDVRILLDGVGGDQTLYHGTHYLTEHFREARFVRFATEFDAFAKNGGWSKRRLFMRAVAQPLAPWPIRRVWRWFNGEDDIANKYQILDSGVADETKFRERFSVGRLPPTNHREEQRRDIADPIQNFFLEIADVERARLGLEPRYPFFDRRLVEFCLSLPADQKVQRGVGRQILRRSLEGTLPEKVRTRTSKADFVESWLDGLYNHERDQLHERLVRSPRYATTYLDGDLGSAYQRFTEEPSYESAVPLVNTYVVESWLRTVNDYR
jgi:asparagine synthase (glutamine-hydrolysing)